MASTTFVDGETLIEASWLNDVNAAVYTPGTQTAADIANVPAGSITATDVQAAINELDTEKVAVASIGTTVQAWDAQLDALALLSTGTASGNIPLIGTSSTTDTLAGLIELATSAEVIAGTDTVRAITPSTLNSGRILTSTVQATTAGSSIDFTSIPSWAKRITVNFKGVSTTGTAFPAVQLGVGGVLETTNYVGCTQRGTSFTAYSTGFAIDNGADGSATISGSMTLSLLDSATNTWACSGVFGMTGLIFTSNAGGHKALAGVLDKVSVVTTNVFDAGSINILYE